MSSTSLGTRRTILLAFAALTVPALAGPNDTHAIHPFAGLGYSYDDNLLRIPDDVPAPDDQRSDRARTTVAGVMIDDDIGRQNIYLLARVNRVEFDHFKMLDYNGRNATGRWNYQIGNDISGKLEGVYEQTLAPYTDFHSDARNLRTEHLADADIAWRFVPDWRLRAAVSRDSFNYDLAIQRTNDRVERLNELGIDYVSPSDNSIGLVVRRIKGSFPNPYTIGDLVVNDNFTQDEVKVRGDWRSGGITHVNVLAGWARRKHVFFNERDASGANGRVTVDWTPHGAVKYNASLYREFSALESSYVSYSLNRGASIGATLEATAKTKFDATLTAEKRSYAIRASALDGLNTSDRLRTASVGVTWTPTRVVQVNLSAYRQSRSGVEILGLGSYKAKGIALNLNAQF